MKQISLRNPSLALCCLLAVACSGGGGGGSGVSTSGRFLVVATEPITNGRLFLNDPIRIDFTHPVDLNSADLNSVSFQVLDQNGNALSEQPSGRFALDRSPGDTDVGRRLMFIPRFPTNNTFDNGGFRPGRTYLVQLVGGDRITGTSLRDTSGRALAVPITFQFTTADGSTPAQLFRDNTAGGPTRVAFQISPLPDAQGVVLNKFGAPPLELRLVFNQPLNPNSNNVPVNPNNNVLLRSVNQRGRLFLEYDDTDPTRGNNFWIPASVEFEVNDLDRAVILLRPIGVLPNNALIRVIVENTLEDISGESNVANAAYSRVFATFQTKAAYEPQFDCLVEDFLTSTSIDASAPFLEPPADVNRGFIQAGFQFEGTTTTLDYQPISQEVVLNTDFTQIVPANGTPFNVSGGVFNFRNVTIPQGVTVRGIGTKPMIWLCSNDFRVTGLLSVAGGNGDRVNTLNSANFPAAGGVGVCGGGNGGQGSPSSLARSPAGQAGFGPGQVPGKGGKGGLLSCTSGCTRGSGGGGGSLATQGDPWFKQLAGTGTIFQQQIGKGGQGCLGAAGAATRTLAGGDSGPLSFSDARTDNNFWGVGVRITGPSLRIVGELANPVGGEGGGGGGDNSSSTCVINDPNFANDNKGGGGGGGGGVLIVKALHDIIVDATGRITADSGNGGGGEPAGSCGNGGGGGSGSGGMVVLMAGHQIKLNVKGVAPNWTYGTSTGNGANNYDFCVSADGQVCLTGDYSTPVVHGKYGNSGQAAPIWMTGANYDSAPLGALGGMGIVQLMAPPGDPASASSNADQTNTVLDDNIIIVKDGVTQNGQSKKDLIAWRGFPNSSGVLVDDFNVATNIGANEGDIRPAPILLPVPFSTRSRARSIWIDTGASLRRPLTSPDGNPRGIVEDTVNGFLAGPTYEWAGTVAHPSTTPSEPLSLGYASYNRTGSQSVQLSYPIVRSGSVLSTDANASYLGQPAYRVELTAPALGAVVDRYLGYEAELLSSTSTVLGSFRILSHTDRSLLLSVDGGVLPTGVVSMQVLAKFYKLTVNGVEGLGPTYTGSNNVAVPQANVRIGFAFHRNPAIASTTPGTDPNRFPTAVSQWVFDLADPAVQEQVRSQGMSYMMWDVLFDTSFQTNSADVPPSLSPSAPRPTVEFLRLPMRF